MFSTRELFNDLPSYDDIITTDYTEYDSEKSCNGGAYSYTTMIRKISESSYEVSYHTSADFPYCRANGIFRSCRNCGERELGCELEKVDLASIKAWIVEIYLGHDDVRIYSDNKGTLYVDYYA